MACKISTGLSNDACEFLIGGLASIYIANKQDVITFVDSDVDGVYDSVTMSTSGTNKFYRFQTTKNTSNFTTQLVVSGTNKYYNHTVDMFVSNNDQEALDVLTKLSLGNFVVIAQNRTGKKFILGMTDGLEATVGELNSGTAEGDSAGIHVTLVGANLGPASEFVGTIPV